jgi:hypothetical protein
MPKRMAAVVTVPDRNEDPEEKDIFARIAAGEFRHTYPYPTKDSTPHELTAALIAAEHAVETARDAIKTWRSEQEKTYNQHGAEIHRLFVEALEKEYGMAGHPKAGAVFSKAWESGHSSGYAEVANCYADLVALAK